MKDDKSRYRIEKIMQKSRLDGEEMEGLLFV